MIMHRVKRKLKIAWELIGFKLKKSQEKSQEKSDIYKKPFLDAIKKEIEEHKNDHIH